MLFRALIESATWRRWGDEVAVHEDRSAKTHLLMDGHAELFALLAENHRAMSLHAIARHFMADDTGDRPVAHAMADRPALQVAEPATASLADAVRDESTLADAVLPFESYSALEQGLDRAETAALQTLVDELVALGLVEATSA